jgi:radical SAM superfamily enzyme YgiQ (UPF0313 family)
MEAFYDTPPFPRPALAFLAAYLRQAGVEVDVLDCKYSRLGYDAALNRIKEFNPDIVAVTAMTNEILQASQVTMMVKFSWPKITTVIGGVHVTALPERTLREFPEFDFAVVGEGEIPLLSLVKAIEGGVPGHEPLPGIAGIDADGKFWIEGASPAISDLNTIPVPAWDLFAPAQEYMLHTSRGCPFNCPFCMNFNGRKVRAKSQESVLDEIEWLVEKQGAKSFIFGDEVFTINRNRTVEICKGMIERGLHKKCKWWCVSHVRCIDYELAVLMKKAGCRMLGLGIESGNEARLSEINKGTSVELIQETVNCLKKAGLPFEAYFILGYPDETAETARETVEFAVKINPDMPVIGIMVPYPGTRIGEMSEKGEGGYVLQARSWNDYNKQIGNAISFKNLSRRELERIQLFGYAKVFLRNFRFLEFAKFAWRYRLLAWKSFLKIIGSSEKSNVVTGRLFTTERSEHA